MPALTDTLTILWLALLIDLLFGEPPGRLHLTVWAGKSIEKLEPRFRRIFKNERVGGAVMALSVIAAFALLAFSVTLLSSVSWPLYILVSAFFLKMTFALKCMYRHVEPIARELDSDLDSSRKSLSLVVRRETKALDRRLVASGAVETVAEGFVDGFISPVFYYCIFGLPGAVAYRVINTLDSMVGYKDDRYLRFGWFSARLDTVANYVPSRLTPLIFALSASLLKLDWKSSIRFCRAYHASTSSINAGWPMSSMAGALRVRLEKPGSYSLGEEIEPLSPEKIRASLRVYAASAIFTLLLFSTFLVIGGILYEAYFV
ncbi:MAG: cobalamin biosynthesis protein [Candidatus Methanosuratincola petrocarbonis]